MKSTPTDPVIKFFISVLGLIVIFMVLKELQHIFIPLIIAYFLYFLFEPINKFLIKKRIPGSISVLLDLAILVGLLWGISSVIVVSFGQFGEELPIYEQKLNNLVSSTGQSLGIDNHLIKDFNIRNILSDLDYGGIASGFFSSTLSMFSTLFFVLFFFIFISSGHSKLLAVIKNRYVNNSESSLDSSDTIERTFHDITTQVQRYISIKFFISLSIGVIIGIILWLFGVKFFVVWAVLTFLLNFIPNIGSVVAVVLPSLMALVQFESFGYTLLIAAVITLFQNIIGNIVEPKIFGESLGLNPLVILLSLLLWGYIWGIVGMFLSVPLTAILKIIISRSDSSNLNFIGDLMSN